MANTKVSALSNVASGLLADTDRLPVADISDLTLTYYVTLAQLKTYLFTAPVFAAGSASASSWPKFTAGTVLGTAEAGAIELDSNCFYGTTDAGNRGYIPVRHFIRCDSARTLTSTTSEQAIFNSPTNGRITLETGAYRFRAMLYITGMDAANTTNAAIDPLGAGTATCAAWLWHAIGIDGTPTTAANQTGSFAITQQSVASVVTGVANGNMAVSITGTFEVTGAGTMIPSITTVTGAAASVAIGSFFMFERIGSTSVVSIGQWD